MWPSLAAQALATSQAGVATAEAAAAHVTTLISQREAAVVVANSERAACGRATTRENRAASARAGSQRAARPTRESAG